MIVMSPPIDRRQAIQHLAILSLSTLLPAGAIACSKKPSCLDVTGLSADDVNQRNAIAAYADQAVDAAKKCSLCAHFVPSAPNACGACKIVKGPINPDGTCKLFLAKPA
jgi:hypothetical protein